MSPRENSVKQLSELYNVVIGVALALAITKLVNAEAQSIPIHFEFFFNFLTFIVIVIPFHQGAVRHLYTTYVENGGSSRIRRGALAIDFVLLFFNACVFVALSILLENGKLFLNTLMFLLTIDCIWGMLAYLAFTGAQAQHVERKWALINLLAVVALFLVSKFGPPLLNGWKEEMQEIIFAVCLLRTVIDYIVAWDFYYPPRKAEPPG